jgi:hypothetical protein
MQLPGKQPDWPTTLFQPCASKHLVKTTHTRSRMTQNPQTGSFRVHGSQVHTAPRRTHNIEHNKGWPPIAAATTAALAARQCTMVLGTWHLSLHTLGLAGWQVQRLQYQTATPKTPPHKLRSKPQQSFAAVLQPKSSIHVPARPPVTCCHGSSCNWLLQTRQAPPKPSPTDSPSSAALLLLKGGCQLVRCWYGSPLPQQHSKSLQLSHHPKQLVRVYLSHHHLQ